MNILDNMTKNMETAKSMMKNAVSILENAIQVLKSGSGNGDKAAQYWERMQDEGRIELPKERIYLAGIYGDPDPAVLMQRAKRLSIAAGLLMKQGCLVFSPISHSAYIVEHTPGLPESHKFWLEQCDAYLDQWATKLLVLPNDCWWESIGVRHEIRKALKLNLKVEIAYNLQDAVIMQEKDLLSQSYLIETRLDKGETLSRDTDKRFSLHAYEG